MQKGQFSYFIPPKLVDENKGDNACSIWKKIILKSSNIQRKNLNNLINFTKKFF